jgi:hypothetical protein
MDGQLMPSPSLQQDRRRGGVSKPRGAAVESYCRCDDGAFRGATVVPGAGIGGTRCAQFGSAAALALFAAPQCIWFDPALLLASLPPDDWARAGAANIPATAIAVIRFIARTEISLKYFVRG